MAINAIFTILMPGKRCAASFSSISDMFRRVGHLRNKSRKPCMLVSQQGINMWVYLRANVLLGRLGPCDTCTHAQSIR